MTQASTQSSSLPLPFNVSDQGRGRDLLPASPPPGNPGNLVLGFAVNETFSIGDDITITVVRIKGGQVRLAIMAPKELSIIRFKSSPGASLPRCPDASPPQGDLRCAS